MSGAYYNEIDPYAAAWLRNLIAAGHIAPGDVDERSIRDVQPSDLIGYTQCHFFAGIGVWSYALRRAGWDDARPVWTGSCPCQPFSAAGKRTGTADDRHLWPEFFRLIRAHSPHVVFGEQVASKDGLAWLDAVQTDLEGAGYAFGALDLCAAGFGAPHIRQRLFFVADALPAGRAEGRPIAGNGSTACRRSDGLLEHAASEQVGLPGRPRQSGEAACELAYASVSAGQRGEPQPSQRAMASGDGEVLAGDLGDADDAGPQGRSLPSAASGRDGAGERVARAPGPVNGFWADADWLPCIDGKARPTQPIAQQMADGASESLGRLRPAAIEEITQEVIHAYPTEADARKAVFALRKAIAAKAMEQRGVGRFHGIQQAPILFAFLLQLAEQGWPLAQGLPRSGKKAAWDELRGVRGNEASACPSCQRGLDEQRPGECSNPVHLLSSILARHAQANWGEAFDQNAAAAFPLIHNATSRVGRLRAYGNAIVAPVAAEFIRAYIECRP